MAGFEIRADLIRALELRLQMYGDVLEEGVGVARDVVYTETMRRANADPRWVHVADFIDTWDENDRFWIGVRSPEMVSDAFAAEYGTDEYPPSPVMRTLDVASRTAATQFNARIASKVTASGSSAGPKIATTPGVPRTHG